MDINAIVSQLDAEIKRLKEAKAVLSGTTKTPKPVKATSFAFGTNNKPRRTMTPEGRARIAAAQKARWAKLKK